MMKLWGRVRRSGEDEVRPDGSAALDSAYMRPFGQLLLWLIAFPAVWLITAPIAMMGAKCM